MGSALSVFMLSQARAAPAVQGFGVGHLFAPANDTPTINPIDNFGIVTAIEQGDQPKLVMIRAALAARTPHTPVDPYLIALADAGLARIAGDFSASNAALDRGLRSVGRHADTTREVNALLLLSESLRYGNMLLSGDNTGWIRRTAWLERVYFAPIRAFFRLPDLQFPNLTMITPLVLDTQVTNPSAIVSDDEQLPFRHSDDRLDNRHAIEARVEATMFGKTQWTLLDTGCVTGVIPAEYVARYHLQVIATSNRGSDGFRRHLRVDYVVIPEIRLGKAVLKNQMFSVAPISYPVLGLQQLGQLRHLSINAHGIRFGRKAPFDCRDRIRGDSPSAGADFELLFPYRLNNHDGVAMLDTGDNSPSLLVIRTPDLPADLAAKARSLMIETIAGNAAYRTVTRPAEVKFTRFMSQDCIKYVQSTIKETKIPTGILNHARFSFDMVEHVACLIPHGADDASQISTKPE